MLITNKSLIDASTTPGINDLLELRKSKGFTTKVEDIGTITRTYSGNRNQKLRNFIKDAYNNWNTEFVCLVGDTKIIPLKTIKGTTGKETDDLPTDLPYQCLDGGAWDNDYEGEVFIGRLSVENAVEMSNQIFKIISYETDPVSESYITTGLSVGEKLDSKTFAKKGMEELEGYFSDDWKFDGLFDKDNIWNKSKLIQMINTSKYSVINHFGHCNTKYAMKMSNGDENKFENDKFIFSKSQGCIPGAFDRDCIGEHFTNSTRTGFFAVVFNSRFGWYKPGSPTGGSSHQLHRAFWKACWEKDMDYLGEFNEYSHRVNSKYRWDVLVSNLIGDPATLFRGKQQPPYITVMSPNGGEKWEVDRTFNIVWDDNVDEQVKIELYKGNTIKDVLASSVPSNGSFEWEIALGFELATDYSIKVSSVSNDTLYDESNGKFTIEEKHSLELISPNGGEVIEKNSDIEIEWEDDLDGDVKLILMRNGSYYSSIIESVPSTGSYTWKVPVDISSGDDYRICVESVEKNWFKDESDGFVSIKNPLINAYPYVQNFDAFQSGASLFREYWEQQDGDDIDWLVNTGKTPSKSGQEPDKTGPDADHTTSSNGNYLYIEASNPNNPGKKADMVTPIFNLTGVFDGKCTFWYHMFSLNKEMGDLNIDICVDSSWIKDVIHLTDDKGDQWFQETIDLSGYEGKNVQFKFRGTTGKSWCSDICVDDFEIKGTINNLPVIVSKPDTTAIVGVNYLYLVKAEDKDNNNISFKAATIPNWLTLTDNNDGTAELKGMPGTSDLGEHSIVVEVSDGVGSSFVIHQFTINAMVATAILDDGDNSSCVSFFACPNPAKRDLDQILFNLELIKRDVKEVRVGIYDATGEEVYLSNSSMATISPWNLNNKNGLKVSVGSYMAILRVKYFDGTIEQIKTMVGVKE